MVKIGTLMFTNCFRVETFKKARIPFFDKYFDNMILKIKLIER